MTDLHIHSWRRPAAFLNAKRSTSGRLAARFEAVVYDGTAHSAQGKFAVEFQTAADVLSIPPREVRLRAPQPGAVDAETTKRAHVDFHAPDYPWRYTPQVGGGKLRPWLVLVVGTPDEVKVTGGTAVIAQGLLAQYPHGDSWQWAHLISPEETMPTDAGPDPRRFSRLISPHHPLAAQTAHVAVLVPNFRADGGPRWDGNGVVAGGQSLPALFSWGFTTGEGGDFETLAAELHLQDGGRIGRAKLFYTGEGRIGPVDVRGALQSLAGVQPVPPPDEGEVAEDMANAVRSTDPVVGPPIYGRPWVAEPGEPTDGWVAQLREDARVRIHTGTGQWIGVLEQDELTQAAVDQAGALPDAAALIARTAGGLQIAGLHWETSMPADPVSRLAVLGPMASRLYAADGGLVADVVGGADSPLDAALFTGAGQRLVGRAAHTEHTADQVLRAMNTVPDDDPYESPLAELWAESVPDGQARYLELWEWLRKLADHVLHETRAERRGQIKPEERFQNTRGLLDDIFAQRDCLHARDWTVAELGLHTWDDVAELLIKSESPVDVIYGPIQTGLLYCILRCYPERKEPGVPSECELRAEALRIPAPRAQLPIGLEGLGNALSEALDPRGPNPPAVATLNERVPHKALASLEPPRFPIELDYPTWSLVKKHAPEWFLPGAGELAKHAVLALRTNPEFIDSFLVGLNTQFLSELRWRGMQADRWGTPLCMFFAPVDPKSGKRTADITPISAWMEDSGLGDRSHQATAPAPSPDQGSAERLVLLFHTPLFRRYPRTLVYLQRKVGFRVVGRDVEAMALQAEPQLAPPLGANKETWFDKRTQFAPTFTGSISPDLVFFGFDIAPTSLANYFVVLDEPPADVRFRADLSPREGDDTSAKVGNHLLDDPSRVAIDGAALAAKGGQQ